MKQAVGFIASLAAIGVGAWVAFRRGGGSLSGAIEARELQLYCENDGQLHEQQGRHIEANLRRKIAKGTYNHELAKKAWEHFAESCAKKYVKEFGSEGLPWHKLFSTADRREVAKNFADHFKNEHDIQHRVLHGRW